MLGKFTKDLDNVGNSCFESRTELPDTTMPSIGFQGMALTTVCLEGLKRESLAVWNMLMKLIKGTDAVSYVLLLLNEELYVIHILYTYKCSAY